MSSFFKKLTGKEPDPRSNAGAKTTIDKGNNGNVSLSSSGSNQDVETLNESKRDIILHVMKQFKFGEPIKHITLPCFVLQPRSMLESFSDSYNCLEELFKIQEIENEEARFIQVLKFSLSAWHTRPKGIKKPFNPIIGEVFQCSWRGLDTPINSNIPQHNDLMDESQDDNSYYISEQISHHPSHSAYCFYNKKRGIIINANIEPEYVKFYGNHADSHLKGIIVYHFLKTKETYEMTLPVIGVRGIILGKLQPFIIGKSTLKKLNGPYEANIEFQSNGLLTSSKYHNGVKGQILKNNTPIYKIKGHWDNQINLVRVDPGLNGGDIKLFQINELKKFPFIPVPFDQQPLNSSEHIWKGVCDNINNNRDKETAEEKHRIEQKQREEEAYRRDHSIEWVPSLFVRKPYNNEHQNTYIFKDIESIFPKFYSSKPIN